MPIGSVNFVPPVIQPRTGDADRAYAVGAAQTAELLDRANLRPYVDDATRAVALDQEALARASAPLREEEAALRREEIKAKKNRLASTADLETEAETLRLKSLIRGQQLVDVLFPKHAATAEAEAEAGLANAQVGSEAAKVRVTSLPAIRDAISSNLQAVAAESAAVQAAALRLKDDPYQLGKMLTTELAKRGVWVDSTRETPEQLTRKMAEWQAQEYRRLQQFAILEKKLAQNPVEVEGSLRKEMAGLKEVQEYRAVETMLRGIEATTSNPNASAADDLATIFSFMKLLDPGSTVREGEFANAQNAAGVPDRIINGYNRLLSGTRLSPEQRAEFLETSRAVVNARKVGYDQAEQFFTNIATAYGVDPGRVIRGAAADVEPKVPQPKAGTGKVTAPASKAGAGGTVEGQRMTATLADGSVVTVRVIRSPEGHTRILREQ